MYKHYQFDWVYATSNSLTSQIMILNLEIGQQQTKADLSTIYVFVKKFVSYEFVRLSFKFILLNVCRFFVIYFCE